MGTCPMTGCAVKPVEHIGLSLEFPHDLVAVLVDLLTSMAPDRVCGLKDTVYQQVV